MHGVVYVLIVKQMSIHKQKRDGGTEKEILKCLNIREIREINYAFLHKTFYTKKKVRFMNGPSNLDSVAKPVTC
jgi:hypothetical protein